MKEELSKAEQKQVINHATKLNKLLRSCSQGVDTVVDNIQLRRVMRSLQREISGWGFEI